MNSKQKQDQHKRVGKQNQIIRINGSGRGDAARSLKQGHVAVQLRESTSMLAGICVHIWQSEVAAAESLCWQRFRGHC